jgi:hypothetical protein
LFEIVGILARLSDDFPGKWTQAIVLNIQS